VYNVLREPFGQKVTSPMCCVQAVCEVKENRCQHVGVDLSGQEVVLTSSCSLSQLLAAKGSLKSLSIQNGSLVVKSRTRARTTLSFKGVSVWSRAPTSQQRVCLCQAYVQGAVEGLLRVVLLGCLPEAVMQFDRMVGG
jgi:hypothetical protein